MDPLLSSGAGDPAHENLRGDAVVDPTIGRVIVSVPGRRRLVVLLCLLTAVVLIGSGSPSWTGNPLAPAPASAAGKETKKKPAKPKYTLQGELAKLRTAKAISPADYGTWLALYRDTEAKAKALPKGVNRTELLGVLADTDEIAAARKLTGSLAPSVFLTLQVNRDWWTTQGPPATRRPVVPGSPLTWQYYPGEGLQIQWLATFGNANALATTKTPAKLAQLKAIEDQALQLASQRAGGPAWQYLFDFGGGKPPWGSGMAQVTGMQSLVRATAKLGDPVYQATALKAVSLLRHSTPNGALLKRPGGDHILLYTFTTMQVQNAFTQAVSGLHEIAATTGDPKVSALYVRAERELRIEMPSYLTSNWSIYNLHGANETPSYHTLTRDLMREMCTNLTVDAQRFAAGQPVAGGLPPAPAAPYCTTAARFTAELKATPNGPKSSSRTRGAAAGLFAAPPVAVDPAATLGSPALAQP